MKFIVRNTSDILLRSYLSPFPRQQLKIHSQYTHTHTHTG